MSSVVGLSLGVDYEGHNQSHHGDRNWLEEWGNWFGFVCVIFIVSMEMFKCSGQGVLCMYVVLQVLCASNTALGVV